MPRGGTSRRWIKLYVESWLNGSIRHQLTAEERGVWADLLAFCAIGGMAPSICDHDGRAFPHPFLAGRFNIPLKLLESTLDKCKAEGRITEDEHGIGVTNWVHYQSEYERQKPYR